MKVEIRLGDDTFLVKSGECYSIDYNNTDLNRVSRKTFKEFDGGLKKDDWKYKIMNNNYMWVNKDYKEINYYLYLI